MSSIAFCRSPAILVSHVCYLDRLLLTTYYICSSIAGFTDVKLLEQPKTVLQPALLQEVVAKQGPEEVGAVLGVNTELALGHSVVQVFTSVLIASPAVARAEVPVLLD